MAKLFKTYIDDYIVDTYGTVVGIINPKAKYKVVIEAHADEISWFVHYITKDGFIYLRRNGGSDHQIAPSKRVNIHTQKGVVKAVFGWPAIHTRSASTEKSPKLDNIFLDEAINNLQKNPIRYIKLYFKKLFSFYFIDLKSSYPNYYNLFHIIPIIILSLLSFPSLFVLFRTNKFENKCLGLYLFSNLIIFSIFFILPRYKLVIMPIQIILSAYTLSYIIKKLAKKKFFKKIFYNE